MNLKEDEYGSCKNNSEAHEYDSLRDSQCDGLNLSACRRIINACLNGIGNRGSRHTVTYNGRNEPADNKNNSEIH